MDAKANLNQQDTVGVMSNRNNTLRYQQPILRAFHSWASEEIT